MTDFKLNHTYKMTWNPNPITGAVDYLVYKVDEMDDINIHVTILKSTFNRVSSNTKKTFKKNQLHDQIEDITDDEKN